MLSEIRVYYLVAILIVIGATALFMLSFEKRKPQVREIVLLAVMTAIAIVSRVIFFMTPQIKPIVAIIIIIGIMMGKTAGFLSGAMAAFISGFAFGQGPWTPWQMIGLGFCGFAAAVIFDNERFKWAKNKWILCLTGFIITVVIYGLIVDTSTVFAVTETPTLPVFLSIYGTGFIYNVIHGVSTVIFLWILANPFFNKITRIKIKYGMYKEK